MRHRYAVVFLLIALTINGQQEPLPPVVPRSTPLVVDTAPAVVLVVEPFHELHTPTLIEAARANDYLTFDALYREAKARGESLTQFATLQELWTYAVTDPIGAFYGRDVYDRLNRAYPGYAAFIDDYRIIDNNGGAWWPTSETRMFLVDRAVQGRAPRVQVAEAAPVKGAPASAPAGPAASRRRGSAPASGALASAPAEQAASRRSGSAPIVKSENPKVVAPTARDVGKPAIVAEPPARVAARDAARSAGVDASAPQAATPVVATTPVVAAPVRTAARDAAGPAGGDAGVPADSRGILLLVIGIIGVGLLALMLRAPAEAVEAEEKPKATVEPIRRQAAQAPPASPSEPAAPRATGSHG